MGPKEMLVLSQHRDRETGASLVPDPEYVARDYERGAQWEPDVRHTLSSGRLDTRVGPRLSTLPQDVQGRLRRGKGLFKQGRRGIVREKVSGRFSFQVQTTEEFNRGRWPLDSCNGYHGWIEMEDGRIVDGHCDCPDEGALWRGFQVCKHQIWAVYMVREGSYERNRVELWLEYDFEHGESVLARVKEGDALRKPRPGETMESMEQALFDQGYVHTGTAIQERSWDRPFWVQEIYAQIGGGAE